MIAPVDYSGFSIEKKVAVITGAAHGIGKLIANVMATAGADVVIVDYNEDLGIKTAQELQDEGKSVHFIRTDLRNEQNIQDMVKNAATHFGGVDIVINNARPHLTKYDFAECLEEWDLTMQVLLKAPALVSKCAIPYLANSEYGSIINISSTNASSISQQPATYHIAKAGLVQLTRYLAYNLGPQNIRVNAISPALVDLYDENRPLTSNPEKRQITESIVPLRRAATGENIADLVVFLSSKAASYITGEVITIDGGYTLGDPFHNSTQVLKSNI